MGCKCLDNECKCNYLDKLELINIDNLPPPDSVKRFVFLNNKEILIVVQNYNQPTHQLKKYVLDNNLTQMTCSFTVDMPPDPPNPGNWLLLKLNEDSFLCVEETDYYLYIMCSHTGRVLDEIILDEDNSILGLCLFNELLIMQYLIHSDDSDVLNNDIDAYSLEDKEAIFTFEQNCECLDFSILSKSFIILITQDDELTTYSLSLWKYDETDFTFTQMNTIEKAIPIVDRMQIDVKYDDCCLVYGSNSKSIDMYKCINDNLDLIKVIARNSFMDQLSYNDYFKTINKFNVISIKCFYKTEPEQKITISLGNLLSGKHRQILEFNTNDLKHFSMEIHSTFRLKFMLSEKDVTLLLFPSKNFKPFFKLKLDDEILEDVLYPDIRKYARVLSQAHRTNTSLFCTLPVEITIFIICKTRSSCYLDHPSTMYNIAHRFFSKPCSTLYQQE